LAAKARLEPACAEESCHPSCGADHIGPDAIKRLPVLAYQCRNDEPGSAITLALLGSTRGVPDRAVTRDRSSSRNVCAFLRMSAGERDVPFALAQVSASIVMGTLPPPARPPCRRRCASQRRTNAAMRTMPGMLTRQHTDIRQRDGTLRVDACVGSPTQTRSAVAPCNARALRERAAS